ncbi:hypothetical protein [Methanoculleus formosensis]|uniref:hypothetical protein n=1 Tax=Methanoculleus formosensis TaxID=2590886 RepID=UPI0021BF636A|nr:hypothetical protein [Methanoculleus sp. Afa-1]
MMKIAPGVFDVAGIPGDDVEVHHRLADEEGFRVADEGEEGDLFRVGRIEEVGDVAEGDEEEVAGARGALSFQPLDPSHSTGTPDPADKPLLPEHRILLARLKKMIGITQHHAYITHHKSRFPRSIHVLLK